MQPSEIHLDVTLGHHRFDDADPYFIFGGVGPAQMHGLIRRKRRRR